MRALGVDLGTKRIGIALSNSERTLATPYCVIHRSKNTLDDYAQIIAIANEWEASTLIFGLPISLDGTLGPAARKTNEEIQDIGKLTEIGIETFDERFTTITAERMLREQNKGRRKSRDLVDQIAASIILQAWLDSQLKSKKIMTADVENE